MTTPGPCSKVEGCVQVVLNYLVLLLFSKRKRDKIKSRRFISSTWIYTHSQHKLCFLLPTVNSLNVQRLKILLSPATVISQLEELSAAQILRAFPTLLQITALRTKRCICVTPSWLPNPDRPGDNCRWKMELQPHVRGFMHLHVQQTAQKSLPRNAGVEKSQFEAWMLEL